jgi:uncharacterized SAM-binding protein YcdF (DUF218 family)
MSFLKRILVISILLIVVFLLLSSLMKYREQIQLWIGNFLIVQDAPYPADVIHVIAGDDYRTEYAIQLYKQGFARSIFFTGGWCVFHGYNHGEHGLQLALSEGVPREDIAYDESPVFSTYDEAVLLKKYLDKNLPSAQTIIVVSDPFHMRRARWTYKMVFGKGMKVIMQPVPFSQTPFKQQWWTDDTSRTYVRDEYKKLIYYFFRYQLGWTWLSFLDTE